MSENWKRKGKGNVPAQKRRWRARQKLKRIEARLRAATQRTISFGQEK